MYEAILFQFPNCCSLFYEKNCRAWTQQIFSLNDYEATREARSLEAHTKGGAIGEKLMHRCGLLLDVSCEQKSFAYWTYRYHFSRVENIVRSSDWLKLIYV